jgi:hypothetical protein
MISQFALFKNKVHAEDFINKINKALNFSSPQTWDFPKKHPSKEEFLVKIHRNQIPQNLLTDQTIIEYSEAKTEGYYLGLFEGSFAREREKMEDIYCLFDAILQNYGKPNFPATRSLILSMLSACYALKLNLRDKLKNLEQLDRSKQLIKIIENDSLIKKFENFMNMEKHGNKDFKNPIILFPEAIVSSLIVTQIPLGANINTMISSSEGTFVTLNQGNMFERRFPVGLQDARYEITVINPPEIHDGRSIKGFPLLAMLELIVSFYAKILFEIRRDFDKDFVSNMAFHFSGDQNMTLNKP